MAAPTDPIAPPPPRQKASTPLDPPSTSYDPRPELPTATHYKLGHTLADHSAGVTSVRFQREGTLAASASGDRTAKIWDVQQGKAVHTLTGHTEGLNDIVWNWNGDTVATASDDTSVRVWDVRSGKCVRKLQGHSSYIMSCSFSASGEVLASAGYDETIRLWCMHTGRLIRSIPAHSDPIFCIDFSADVAKPVLASGSNDGICRIWVSHTGECGRSIIPEAGGGTSGGGTNNGSGSGGAGEHQCVPVTFCKFTPNNKFLLLGTLNGRLQLWDFEPKKSNTPTPAGIAPVSVKKTYMGHKNTKYPLQASFMVNEPTGNKYVVSGSEDHHIFMWDLNNRTVAGVLRGRSGPDSPGDGHCDVVMSVDTNPAEPVMASAGGPRDRTVKIWKYCPTAV